MVLVDSIVTDKKGNYIRDLTQKNFRVWEDNKEQEVKSFSYESGNASPNNPMKRYLVLFFDNSTMEFAEQAAARQAAAKFIDDNAGPNRQMAIADFGGTLRITQNFTADAERLKKVVAGTKFATVSPNGEVASLGAPPLMSAEADFGARSMLWAVRDLAKSLATVPGRKSVVLLTAGFPLTPERQSAATGLRAGVSAVGGLLVARWLAADPLVLRRAFADLACHLRQAAMGLPARLPRLWHI